MEVDARRELDAERAVRGGSSSNVVTSLVRIGCCASPSPYTSTRSGSPVDSSAQTSTRAIVERRVRRHQAQPGGAPARHAARRDPRQLAAASRPSSSRRGQGDRGTMSLSSGSRIGGPRDLRAVLVLVASTGSTVPPSRTQVGLAGRADPVDPPVLVVPPPDAQLAAARRAVGRPRRTSSRSAGPSSAPWVLHLAGPAECRVEARDALGERGGARRRCRERGQRGAGRVGGAQTPSASSATTSQRAAGTILTTYVGAPNRRTGRMGYDLRRALSTMAA